MSKFSSYLSQLTNLDKFLSGLIVVDTLYCCELYSEESFSTDPVFENVLAESLYLPLKDVTKCIEILTKLSLDFK